MESLTESSLEFTEPFCSVILEAAGSWIFFVLKVCEHTMKRLSSWRRPVFFKRLQQNGHEFRDETELLAKENL